MRVCIVTRGDLFPTDHGAAVKIVRTAEHLSLEAKEPCFVVTDDRDHYLRFDGRSVHRVPYPARLRASLEWPPLPRFQRLSERACERVGYPVEEVFLYRPQFDPAWWMRTIGVAQREGCSVIQAEFPGYATPAALGARLLRRLGHPIRSSVVQHNVEWDRLEEFGHGVKNIRRLELANLRMVDDVIAVSVDDRRRMVAAGVDPSKVSVIPHGVDLLAFRQANGAGIRQRYGIAADAPLLFFHGTLHYWPNTEAVRFIVEQLLPRLLPRWPNVRVLMCGQGAPTYYAHPAVIYAGSVADLPAHVAAADLALCPVQSGGGTRMKLLEYLAAGRAVVSTTKGAEGIPYEAGRDMEIADGVDAFVGRVAELLADPQRRASLGRAGANFSLRYDWGVIARAYLELYGGTGRGSDWSPRLRPDPELQLAAHLPPRTVSKPRTLLLLINRGCNLRCAFCDLYDSPEKMPLSRVFPLLDEAKVIDTQVLVITGGEPFLHPDLFVVVAAARARGMGVNITTNGLLVDRRWNELITSGVSSLSMSLDGLEQTHDTLRGQKGAFRKTMAALARVLGAGIPCSVYFTVTRTNVGELVSVWRQVMAMGAGFDFWPVNDAPDLALQTPEEKATFLAAVAEIGAADREVASRQAYYAEGLDYHGGKNPSVRCLGLIDQYGVKYDGTFLPCCVWGGDGLALGNVFETPLRTLWTSPKVQEFRERMFAKGCTAGCYNHSLYEFSASTGLPFRVSAPG